MKSATVFFFLCAIVAFASAEIATGIGIALNEDTTILRGLKAPKATKKTLKATKTPKVRDLKAPKKKATKAPKVRI